MKVSLRSDNRGLAAVAIVLVVVLLAAVSGVGYYVFSKQKDSGGTSVVSDVIRQAASNCQLDDKDLCKFFASWKESKHYKLVSESVMEGVQSTSTFMYTAPDKSHMIIDGTTPMEMISIGQTTYTKDAADGKWWKQTLKPEDASSYTENFTFDFEEPASDTSDTPTTSYKQIGKEACGDLECFKYQVIDPSNTETAEYIWFDTDDYQLRRSRSEYQNGDYTDSTFSYEQVDITEPSPVKEVGENQVVVPGSSVPMDMPSEEELQRMMDESAEAMNSLSGQ